MFNEKELLDYSILSELENLEKQGAENLIQSLITDLQQNAPTLCQNIKQSVSQLDASAAEHASHTLKSSMAALGGRLAAELCQRIEDAAENGSVKEISLETLVRLNNISSATLKALAEYLKSKKPVS